MIEEKSIKNKLFSNETVEALAELGIVLERIHRRLLAEGYSIESGKIYKQIYNISN